MYIEWTVFFLLPLAALALDLILGDPPSWPHPVRYIGRLLAVEEAFVRRLAPGSLKAAGAACLALNAAGVFLAVKLLTMIPVLGWLAGLYLAYAGLALGQLLRECRAVARDLKSGRLEEARARLGGLVSRDVSALDEAGMRRTLAETLSENLNDGLVAPFFFLALGGPALLWAYKVVSTMDSMWGYRTEAYGRLGWAAAKADDVCAFLPARLTAAAMIGAGFFMGLSWRCLEAVRNDALTTESPNAGWPMAAAAWLLGAPVGGPAVYFGAVKDKPVLGPRGGGSWDDARISRLVRLAAAAGIGSALLMQCYFHPLLHGLP